MKILGIVGSTRKQSYNRMIMEYLVDEFGDTYEIEIAEIGDLPLYNQDIEMEKFESVERLRNQIKGADGIIFVTPEHNSSIPAALKNAIDWMSRVNPVFMGKPAMIMGSSIGILGSIRAQLQLRAILNTMGLAMHIQPGEETVIGAVADKFDENGKLVDEYTKKHLNEKMKKFEVWINKIKD